MIQQTEFNDINYELCLTILFLVKINDTTAAYLGNKIVLKNNFDKFSSIIKVHIKDTHKNTIIKPHSFQR